MKNNDMISKLSIIKSMMKEMNFVLEFHKETPMESVVTKQWEEIQKETCSEKRAIVERAFYKENMIPFHAIVAMIVNQLCEVAENARMPLCSCDENVYYYNGSYWQMIDQNRVR